MTSTWLGWLECVAVDASNSTSCPRPAGFGPADIPATLAAFKTLSQSVSPETHYVVGDIPGTYITANGDGLYYATGDIVLDEDLVANVTLVAEGTITVSSSVNTLSPYPGHPPGLANVLVYSGADPGPPPIERCDKFTVKMDGSTSDWTGLIVGPAGVVEFSGSSTTTLTGSLIGWAVRLNGSDLQIISDPSFIPADFKVDLLE